MHRSLKKMKKGLLRFVAEQFAENAHYVSFEMKYGEVQ